MPLDAKIGKNSLKIFTKCENGTFTIKYRVVSRHRSLANNVCQKSKCSMQIILELMKFTSAYLKSAKKIKK